MSIGRLAFPGPTNSTVQVVGRDAFLDALDDHRLRVRVLEREPQTLEAALSIASRLEAYDKSTVVSTAAGSTDMTEDRANSGYVDVLDRDEQKNGKERRQVKGASTKVSRKGEVLDADAWRDMISQLAEIKTVMETDRSSWESKFRQLQEAVASSSPATLKVSGVDAGISDPPLGCCYHCKAPGCYKRDCPYKS
jgi:hypothetical protein